MEWEKKDGRGTWEVDSRQLYRAPWVLDGRPLRPIHTLASDKHLAAQLTLR